MISSICPICLQQCAIMNSHHIIPKHLGGSPEGPLLDLCENCHKALHYTAETEYRGEQASFLLPAQRARAHQYVEAIKRAKQIFEAAGGGENIPRKVMLKIPQKDLTKLHKLKADKGFSSLEKYLLHLIYTEIKKL